MVEEMIKRVKSENAEVLEIADIDVDEKLVYAFTDKDYGKKSSVVVYKFNEEGDMELTTEVTLFLKGNEIYIEVTEDGSTRLEKTELDYKGGKISSRIERDSQIQASTCEQAINILCIAGGRTACQAACRAIPIIGVLLGTFVCRSLCSTIVADGCNAAKRKFC